MSLAFLIGGSRGSCVDGGTRGSSRGSMTAGLGGERAEWPWRRRAAVFMSLVGFSRAFGRLMHSTGKGDGKAAFFWGKRQMSFKRRMLFLKFPSVLSVSELGSHTPNTLLVFSRWCCAGTGTEGHLASGERLGDSDK